MGKEDCQAFRTILEQYQVTDAGPEDIYTMVDDPTSDDVKKTIKSIKKRLYEKPETNFLIFYVVIGQGLQSYGQQIVLLNEVNKMTNFYKHWSVETDIRNIARNFPNAYQVAFFSCGRELWSSNKHIGCFKSEEEA